MALELAAIGGYLTVWLLRGAGRLADRTLDHLIDRFATLVGQHIDRRTLKALQKDPGGDATNRASHKIEAAAQHDPAFASKLQEVIRELNGHGGLTLINQVQQNVKQGIAIGRDLNINAPDPDDWSGAPSWVKMIFVMGFAVCALGMGIGFYMMDHQGGGPLGLGIFFVGFVILAIGALGRMMSRRK